MKKKRNYKMNNNSRKYKCLFFTLLAINVCIVCVLTGYEYSKATRLAHREAIYHINQALYANRLDYYNLHTDFNNSYHISVKSGGVGVKEVTYHDGLRNYSFSINKNGLIIVKAPS